MKTLIVIFLLALAGSAQAQTQTATMPLSWNDNSTNEDGFKIERSTSPNGPFALAGSVVANVNKYSDVIPNDPGGQQYCYRVHAFNGVGVSGYSNIACVTTPVVKVPPNGVPGGLSVSVTVTITTGP